MVSKVMISRGDFPFEPGATAGVFGALLQLRMTRDPRCRLDTQHCALLAGASLFALPQSLALAVYRSMQGPPAAAAVLPGS